MKIKIAEKYWDDLTDKYVVDRIEYQPTISDAKEWASTNDKLVYISDVTGMGVDAVERHEAKIEKEYLRLLGPVLVNEYINKFDFNDWLKNEIQTATA